MLFAIDIGNTQTSFCLFKKHRLVTYGQLKSSGTWTKDELWHHLNTFLKRIKIPRENIDGAAIASVVPVLTRTYTSMCKKYLKIEPLIISSSLDLNMRIRYDDPSTLGADRLCNVVATFDKYGGPAIAIDFGTATTFDVVSKKGDFLGGVIAPGVETSAAELYKRTAQLPKIPFQLRNFVIGTNTIACMQSGIIYSAVDAMEGIVKRIKKMIGQKAIVIATGGYGQLIAKQSKLIDHVEPHLVLEGARLIYELVNKRKK
ncbi:MAG TPA: type III pantothenate kinase [Bacteroidota bacterium]|nr:type III pantothenate kinase [Bacteroidota bacterium]